MEGQRWVDEDASININTLSDQDRIDSSDSITMDFPNLETQESTNSDPKGK